MRCKTCKTEFTGETCPECGAKKADGVTLVFYKNAWFWVTVCLVLLWIVSFAVQKLSDFSNQVSKGAQSQTNYTEEFESFLNTQSVNTKSDKPNNIASSSQKPVNSINYSSNSAYEESSYNASKKITTVLDQNSIVYISQSGKRYHLSATCAGKNASETTLKNAEELNKTPCQKCVK